MLSRFESIIKYCIHLGTQYLQEKWHGWAGAVLLELVHHSTCIIYTCNPEVRACKKYVIFIHVNDKIQNFSTSVFQAHMVNFLLLSNGCNQSFCCTVHALEPLAMIQLILRSFLLFLQIFIFGWDIIFFPTVLVDPTPHSCLVSSHRHCNDSVVLSCCNELLSNQSWRN